MKEPLTIVVDTREKDSLSFASTPGISVMRKGLKTGDYSLLDYEDSLCFERKSVQDLVGTLIASHERFLREMERMRTFEKKYILIEHTPSIVYNYCKAHGWQHKFDTVIQSLLAYACHYNVRVRFCKDRHDMEKYIVAKTREFLKEKGEQKCQKGNDTSSAE